MLFAFPFFGVFKLGVNFIVVSPFEKNKSNLHLVVDFTIDKTSSSKSERGNQLDGEEIYLQKIPEADVILMARTTDGYSPFEEDL